MECKIFRPEGYMENPYISKDGGEHHSRESLQNANRDWTERMVRNIEKDSFLK